MNDSENGEELFICSDVLNSFVILSCSWFEGFWNDGYCLVCLSDVDGSSVNSIIGLISYLTGWGGFFEGTLGPFLTGTVGGVTGIVAGGIIWTGGVVNIGTEGTSTTAGTLASLGF